MLKIRLRVNWFFCFSFAVLVALFLLMTKWSRKFDNAVLPPKPEVDYVRPFDRYFTSTELEATSNKELIDYYDRLIHQRQVTCDNKDRFGLPYDGGWDVCVDSQWDFVPPCIVYSFGIDYDFSFDDSVAQRAGCHVYSFDPSLTLKTHNRSKLVHFYDIGVSGKNEETSDGWKLYRLQTIRRMLHHNKRVIDYLKVDVEGAEWSALPEMISTGALASVRQLGLEIHVGRLYLLLWWRKDLIDQVKTLRNLMEEAGFRLYNTHGNWVSLYHSFSYGKRWNMAFELYFVNTKFERPR